MLFDKVSKYFVKISANIVVVYYINKEERILSFLKEMILWCVEAIYDTPVVKP